MRMGGAADPAVASQCIAYHQIYGICRVASYPACLSAGASSMIMRGRALRTGNWQALFLQQADVLNHAHRA